MDKLFNFNSYFKFINRNKDYTFINILGVLIAFVIAVAIIYYSMSKWLSSYSYHINLSPLFITAGLFCLIVSFVAVSVQSDMATNANPVKSIKDN